MYDAIIIGAGLSGLAAGIRLAYFDRKVCILERHTTIGGLNSFYRLNGRNYDVGLHAVTNYSPKGTKRGPLARLLRQLRFSWDEFALCPQLGGTIAFPGVSLSFNNDFEFFESEIARAFPAERERFRRLVSQIAEYDDIDLSAADRSAREAVGEFLRDPLLIEMLFCPLMYYGSARENDMDYGQFCILFRSIFCEGFARPFAGIRVILKNLVRKFKDQGGELRLRSGVSRIAVENGRAVRVILDDGTTLEAKQVISSAGWLETMRMCDDVSAEVERPAGRLSFVESQSILDREPKEAGFDQTVVFFNDSDTFAWQRPDGLADVASGVICSPNNFAYDRPLEEGIIRVTVLANYDRWNALDPESYQLEKLRWYDQMVASAVRFIPDFRSAVIDADMFSPTTIRRFTGHEDGAIYGAAQKQYDGATHLENLYICGTDQGLVGIIGAIISGITIANRYGLR